MKEIIWGSLTIISSIIGGLVASVATKGKLWAESEALPKLTQELESIKSKIGVLSNQQNVLFTEEKEALILFNSDYDSWYSTLQVIMPGSFIHFKEEIWLKFKEDTNKAYDQLRVSRNRLELFIDDQTLLDQSKNLIQKTYDQKKFLDQMFSQIRSLEGRKCQIDIEVHPHSEDYYIELENEIYQPYKDRIKEYAQFTMNKSKELNQLRTNFLKACRSHIRQNVK